jgi:Putative metal-binding motif/Secretion system C-terminal sorting domain/Fibronectin type III domain
MLCSSAAPPGYSTNNSDCKDDDKTIYPGAPELCDSKDNNCNGQTDEGGTTWYRDADGDGYGNPNLSKNACTKPSGYVSNNTDCNDNSKYIHAPVKYYIDNDHDGYGSQTTAMLCSLVPPYGYSILCNDCNDNNAAVRPFAQEICGNGIDDNCNGQVDEGCNPYQNATGLNTTNLKSSSAKLNWSATANPVQWEVDYKKSGSSSWTSIYLSGSARSATISSLSSNQTYNWRIKTKCGNSWTSYSATQTFKTLQTSNTQTRPIPETNETVTAVRFGVMPNPSNTNFKISLGNTDSKEAVKLIVYDLSGRIIETRMAIAGQTLTIGDNYRSGLYIVNMIQGKETKQFKLIKTD